MAAQKKTISKLFSYGYGLGEFGFTFFNFLVAYYLMYYLTDVLCLPMLTAAAIIFCRAVGRGRNHACFRHRDR